MSFSYGVWSRSMWVYRKQPLYLISEIVVWIVYILSYPDPTCGSENGSIRTPFVEVLS
ncbi:hypothetical protein P3L10_011063 [Capsicum annuum]